MDAHKQKLLGRRIMVVEDEYLLADDVSCALRREGATVAGPIASLDQAQDLLADADRIDAAILDIKLREGTSFRLADELEARRIPFLLATGYDADVAPPHLRAAPHVSKPYDLRALVDEVVALLD